MVWKDISNVHCNTVYYSQDLEATWMPIARGMDEEDEVHNAVIIK